MWPTPRSMSKGAVAEVTSPRRIGCALLLAVLAAASGGHSEAPVAALVAGVSGSVRLARAGGPSSPARVGVPLYLGDSVVVSAGTAEVIEISGRLVTVFDSAAYVARVPSANAAGLLNRIGDTVAEIVGPQDDADRPVVHGMARELEQLAGARPAATKVRGTEFRFEWEAPAGVSQFDFTLKRDGAVVARQRLTSPGVDAAAMALGPGVYHWQAEAVGPIVRVSTGRRWVQVVDADEAKRIEGALARVRDRFQGPAATLMVGLALFAEGCLDEAARVTAAAGLPALADSVHQAALARMSRDVPPPSLGAASE